MEYVALKYCIEVYEQYTRAEVGRLHGSVVRCWKVGKRASLALKFTQDCENAAKQMALMHRRKNKPKRRFFGKEAGFISR